MEQVPCLQVIVCFFVKFSAGMLVLYNNKAPEYTFSYGIESYVRLETAS